MTTAATADDLGADDPAQEQDTLSRRTSMSSIVARIAQQCDANPKAVRERTRAHGIRLGILRRDGTIGQPLTNRDGRELALAVYADYHAREVAVAEMGRLRAALPGGGRPASLWKTRDLIRAAADAGAPIASIVLETRLDRKDVLWAAGM